MECRCAPHQFVLLSFLFSELRVVLLFQYDYYSVLIVLGKRHGSSPLLIQSRCDGLIQ